MNDGLHLGDNAKGKLAVRTLNEMKQVLHDLDADAAMADSLAGIGDLLTTGLGDSSFNYRVGKTIAEGIASTRVKSEGLVALEELSKTNVLDIKKYPILHLLNQTVYHYAPCSDLLVLLQDS
jgi:glycerol-3-phosphate dehydrogenase